MSRARIEAERMDRYPASVIAKLIDMGAIDQWPFELTKHGLWLLRHGKDLWKFCNEA